MPVSDGLKRFGDHVREHRRRIGWSQERLAHECGLDRSYVGGVERGERNVSLVNIERIAQSLGIPVALLFTTEVR